MKIPEANWKQVGDTGVKVVIAGAGQCLRVTAIVLYVSAIACQRLGILAYERSRGSNNSS